MCVVAWFEEMQSVQSQEWLGGVAKAKDDLNRGYAIA